MVLLAAGGVIGSAIYIVPGPVLRAVQNSPLVALSLWLGGGVVSLLGALTYAELGIRRPAAGGLYVFLRDAFGPIVAFLFGWCNLLVIGSGTIAALLVACGEYARELVPLTEEQQHLFAATLVITLTVVNLQDVRSSSTFLNVASLSKIVGIAAMASVLLLFGTWPRGTAGIPPHGAPEMRGFAFAITAVLWAYEGWQYAIYLAGETRDPRRSLPLGLGVGMLLVLCLYLLANCGYMAALGSVGLGDADRAAARALSAVSSGWAVKVLTVLVMTSMVSAANACLLTTSRIYYAMAKDGIFFKPFAYVNANAGIPVVAVWGTGACAAVLALAGTFTQLLSYVIYVGWLFYGLGAASLFVLHSDRDSASPRKFGKHSWAAATFTSAASFVLAFTLIAYPVRVWVGLALLLTGLVAYALFLRGRRARTAS